MRAPSTPVLSVFTVLILGLFLVQAACEPSPPTAAQIEARSTEENQQRLIQAIKPPVLTTSLERLNLAKRLERLNTENLVSYIYLLSKDGKIVSYHTVDGKVTSLNAYLTADFIQKRTWESAVVETQLPDYDGAYGKNAEGVFFFTTDGIYVEWVGDYLWSDRPLKVTQQPLLLYDVGKK